MSEIVFYDFWDKNPKRKPLARIKSINEIQIVDNRKNSSLENNFENRIILLNGSKYRIVHVNKKLEKNSIASHHMTNDEISYEVIVETK